MEIFDKIRQVIDCLSPWIAMGGRDPVQRGETPDYDDYIWRWCYRVGIKGCEKRTWLWNLLLDDERECMYIENLDAVYEDMESLSNLDVTNTIRSGQHVKNCALQNV